MTNEANQSNGQNPIEFATMSPEALQGAAATVHTLVTEAVIATHDGDTTTNPIQENLAVGKVLNEIAKGEHGSEAQVVVWEAGAAVRRRQEAIDTVTMVHSTVRNTRDYTLDTVDFRNNPVSRTRVLYEQLRGPYGVVPNLHQSLSMFAGNVRKSYEGDTRATDDQKLEAWQHTVNNQRRTASDDIDRYASVSRAQVTEAAESLNTGALTVNDVANGMYGRIGTQNHVRQALAKGEKPVEGMIQATSDIYTLAEGLKNVVKESDPIKVAEFLSAVVQSAPSGELISAASTEMANTTGFITRNGGAVLDNFESELRMTVPRVQEDVDRELVNAGRRLFDTNVAAESSFMLLETVPKSALAQLEAQLDMWSTRMTGIADQLAASIK